MENYQALLQEIETCQACPLCQARTNVVPGDGNLQAKIMFIGEGPGAEEDKRGVPFVGAAGQLLDQMLDTIGLRQIEIVDPKIIVLLGATALNHWFSKDMRITKVRGQWFEKQGRQVMATFHPAALLRDAKKKPDSFEDFLSIKQKLLEI